MVTSACYQHSHFASNDIVPTLNPQTEVTPSKRAQNKRFSIIRKKSEAPSTSFIREGSAPLTEGDLTDSSVSSARRKYKKRRTFSDTSVMLSQSSQAARVRHLVPDGAARAAFLQQQKRNLYRLSTPPAQEGLDPVAASPRIKSDRERGLSLQHNLSHSRSGSDAGDPSGSLPSSPTESISSSSQFIGKKRTYSSISNDRSFSHTATPFMDTLIANPIQAPAGWGSAPRRSPSPAPVDASMTLHQYLTSLHPLLGDLDPAFRSAGIFDVSTVLSLEKSELEAVIDGFSSEHSTLQRMLAKNRIGRSLS